MMGEDRRDLFPESHCTQSQRSLELDVCVLTRLLFAIPKGSGSVWQMIVFAAALSSRQWWGTLSPTSVAGWLAGWAWGKLSLSSDCVMGCISKCLILAFVVQSSSGGCNRSCRQRQISLGKLEGRGTHKELLVWAGVGC